MVRILRHLITHGAALAVGFALGIYFLPILTAPPNPSADMLEEKSQGALFTAELTRDLEGSDLLHWGEGTLSITATEIVHTGKLAPGPDYFVYLTKDFVEHEDTFTPIKSQSLQVGPVKTFGGFVLEIPENVDVTDYSSIVIWCESFGEFITAAKYR